MAVGRDKVAEGSAGEPVAGGWDSVTREAYVRKNKSRSTAAFVCGAGPQAAEGCS
ncbi:hypothetical protein GCM10009107_18260 [Ideonella azotifigens]|uniref:Uncharacterized protein n=1 Tax=Ideonella azotifigens TaxID=513160 RepID=A0ABN1JXC8_9BURK